MKTLDFRPIGFVKSHIENPYEAPRQGVLNTSEIEARIELVEGYNFEQALEDLAGFDRIWLLTLFHHNHHWKHKVRPPRGTEMQKGVFATRSPYRPNPIGLTAARLLRVQGRTLYVTEHDLMNETPVLDIKPYIPYADAFPEARMGWLENVMQERWSVVWEDTACTQASWIYDHSGFDLSTIVNQQLEYSPLSEERKRVMQIQDERWILKLRTWRIHFEVDEALKSIQVLAIHSGYSAAERADSADPYGDKILHSRYIFQFHHTGD